MAVVHAAQRNNMPASDFAVPGKRNLLIHDKLHAKLAWRMLNRTGGLTPEEKAQAKSRILARLTHFGVDTSKYDEKLSWSAGIPYTSLGTTALIALTSFVDDLEDKDEKNSMTEALTSSLFDRMTARYRELHQRDMLMSNIACEFKFSDGCYSALAPQVLSASGSAAKLKIPVAKLGTYVHPTYGTVDFTQKDFDDIKQNFADNEAGFKPYLRYGHAKFPEAVDAEPAVAYLEDLSQEGDVLYGIYDPVDTKVVNQVDKGKYVSASAELKRHAISKKDGRPIGTMLTAHALTNAPFMPDLPHNQVLSDASPNFITLCMSDNKGETNVKNTLKQVHAEVDGMLQKLSISTTEREALREKLAKILGAEEPAGYDSNKDAGVPGDDPSASDLSDPDLLSEPSHGAPLHAAAKALDKMGDNEDKESMSTMVGEILSTMAKFFGVKPGAAGGAGAAHKPAGVPGNDPAANRLSTGAAAPETVPTTQSLSTAAVATPSAKGGANMDEDKILSLISQAVDKSSSELEQKFSDQLAAKDKVIESLASQLASNEVQTQQYSNTMIENAFTQRVNYLVEQGIPPVLVGRMAEIARTLRGTELKLSSGAADAQDALMSALELLPWENRVPFEQIGQTLSEEAASTGSAGGYDPYAEIIASTTSGLTK